MSSHAYTPGLKVKEYHIASKIRRLPLLGEVLYKENEKVSHNTVVARAAAPGPIHSVNVCSELGIEPEQIEKYMLIKIGDKIEKGQPLAHYKAFFGLLNEICLSPITGTLEMYSIFSGQAMMREMPIPIELHAYIPGIVERVLPKEGVVIKTPSTFIQGIFGIGGENSGEIKIIAETPDDIIEAKQVGPECKGKVLVCGSLVTYEVLKKAIDVGATGLVVGGIVGNTLRDLLGEEIGVIITGQENVGITLIVTEGFGKLSMQKKTFELLKQNEGKLACINGATQIRAGVTRPEIIIPLEDSSVDEISAIKSEEKYNEGLSPGMLVRIIRDPYFGALGNVVELPIDLYKLNTESEVRVLKAELTDGRKVIVPRANVEIIEE